MAGFWPLARIGQNHTFACLGRRSLLSERQGRLAIRKSSRQAAAPETIGTMMCWGSLFAYGIAR